VFSIPTSIPIFISHLLLEQGQTCRSAPTYIKGADFTQALPVAFVQKQDYYLVEDWRSAPIVSYHPAKSNHKV